MVIPLFFHLLFPSILAVENCLQTSCVLVWGFSVLVCFEFQFIWKVTCTNADRSLLATSSSAHHYATRITSLRADSQRVTLQLRLTNPCFFHVIKLVLYRANGSQQSLILLYFWVHIQAFETNAVSGNSNRSYLITQVLAERSGLNLSFFFKAL